MTIYTFDFMRLNGQIVHYLKQQIKACNPDAKVFLFGSRVDDSAKGGDIDILILSTQLIDKGILREMKRGFYKKFGWQKIDLVNFRDSDKSVFKDLVLNNSILL